jgi:hypothetical protein
MAKVLILENPLHHEGHEEHEDFCELGIKLPIPANPDSWDNFPFLHNELFCFVAFVSFVV